MGNTVVFFFQELNILAIDNYLILSVLTLLRVAVYLLTGDLMLHEPSLNRALQSVVLV